MKKLFGSLFDAIFITRPIILIPVWGYFFLGYYRALIFSNNETLYKISFSNFSHKIIVSFSNPTIIFALIMLTFSVAGTYILNQIIDLETDKENDGLPLLAKGGVSIKLAIIENIFLSILPIIYGIYYGGSMLLFLVAAFILTIVYNVKPFKFTGRPFLDFLSNAIGYGIVAFGIGWISALNFKIISISKFLIEALPYFLFMVAGSIGSTIPDEDGDKNTGKVTTVVLLGAHKSNIIGTFAMILALVISIKNIDIIAIITSLASLPFFVKYFFSRDIKDGLKTFQICGGFLMLMIVFIFPWFLIYGIATYLATRLYFKLRHNINYPVAGD